MRIKKGDRVIVIAGKDRGKDGVVLQVFPRLGRVIVEGVNIIKRHQKKNQEHPEGAILEKPAPIAISNVAFYDPKTKKPVKIGFRMENGVKVRVNRKTGQRI